MEGHSRHHERCHLLPFWNGTMPWTSSTTDQWETEKRCEERSIRRTSEQAESSLGSAVKLDRTKLEAYLLKSFSRLPPSYSTLDSSHPWMCFWTINALSIIGKQIPDHIQQRAIGVLKACLHQNGGFAGGPGQDAHLAATYAACMTLACIGTPEAIQIIDVESITSFLYRTRRPDGSFAMTEDGEVDTRAVYCAVAVAVLLNISLEPLFDYTGEWLAECQTYEGGFGAIPGAEAHGGYTYCAFAALFLLDKPFLCDLQILLRWLSFRQMRFEGGFQGRTNKLVDTCYTFWQGAVFPLLQQVIKSHPMWSSVPMTSLLMDQEALQEYVFVCCQNPDGGICDKPNKNSDYYHTCYALAGVSVAQYLPGSTFKNVFGSDANELDEVHAAFNLTIEKLLEVRKYFKHLST